MHCPCRRSNVSHAVALPTSRPHIDTHAQGSIVMSPGLVDRLLQQAAAEREAEAAAAAAGGEGQAAAAHHARRGAALAPRQRTDVSLFGLGQLPWNLLKVGGKGFPF